MALDTLEITPVAEVATEYTAIYDIAVLINAVYQYNLELTQVGRVHKRIANKYMDQLNGLSRFTYNDDDYYAEMLFKCMQEMQLIQIPQPPLPELKITIETGPELANWAGLNLIEQTRRLVELWGQKQIAWQDLVDANNVAYNWSYYYNVDPANGRQTLLQQLKTCTPGQWYRIDSLLQRIFEEDPLSLRKNIRFLSKTEQHKIKKELDTWLGTDGQFYNGMLASSLYEFGLVDLAFTEEEAKNEWDARRPYAFRLTTLGSTLLVENEHKNKQPDATAQDQHTNNEGKTGFIVQPNFEILLLQQDMPALYSILPFAQVNQIGNVSTLKLTNASVLRGLKAGLKIDQIIQTLTERNHKELPQNVVYTMRDWAKQYKEVRVSQAFLIEIPEESTIKQLYASGKLQKTNIRQLTPTLLAIDSDISVSDLKNALEKEGLALHLHGHFSNQSKR